MFSWEETVSTSLCRSLRSLYQGTKRMRTERNREEDHTMLWIRILRNIRIHKDGQGEIFLISNVSSVSSMVTMPTSVLIQCKLRGLPTLMQHRESSQERMTRMRTHIWQSLRMNQSRLNKLFSWLLKMKWFRRLLETWQVFRNIFWLPQDEDGMSSLSTSLQMIPVTSTTISQIQEQPLTSHLMSQTCMMLLIARFQ